MLSTCRVHKAGVTEILRYALDDKMIESFHFDTLIGQEAEGKKTAEGSMKARFSDKRLVHRKSEG